MKLTNINEHLSCHHCDKQNDSSINHIEMSKKKQYEYQLEDNCIFLILEGISTVSFGRNFDKTVKEGDMFLLPAQNRIIITVEEKTTALLFHLPMSFSFCDHYALESLYSELNKGQKKNPEMYILKSNEKIDNYVRSFLPCWKDGLRCQFFFKQKVSELVFLLQSYTPRTDLVSFFAPILTGDMEFYALVLNNYKTLRTIDGLAKLTDYSRTGFEKRFKRIFGMPAYQWMKKQRAADLYHEIRCTKKTFTEISVIYGFSSSAHFSNFCKDYFGLTPKAIRKGEAVTVIEDDIDSE